MTSRQEVYVSTDVEADGPIPGPNSMLALGSAAFVPPSLEPVATFQVRLVELPGAAQDQDTMAFWAKNPAAWEWLRQDPRCMARAAMPEYRAWLEDLPGRPVFVGYPATYDFMFVHWYLVNFAGGDPFGFQGLDVKSYASAVMGMDFHQTSKRTMPRRWHGDDPHTHVPLDDALEQGRLFLRMREENLRQVARLSALDGA